MGLTYEQELEVQKAFDSLDHQIYDMELKREHPVRIRIGRTLLQKIEASRPFVFTYRATRHGGSQHYVNGFPVIIDYENRDIIKVE